MSGIKNRKDEFDLTDLGFLPISNEVECSGFEEWERLATTILEMEQTKVRKTIEKLEPISSDIISNLDLSGHKKLYTILSILSSSYVWSEPLNPPDYLPHLLSIPLCAAANELGIQPILTHTSVDLLNWKLKDPSREFELDNLQCLYLMTGTPSEEWFYLIMVAIEGEGGKIIDSILKIEERMGQNQIEEVTDFLDDIAQSMEKIIQILSRLPERCDPRVFWTVLRPYLSGWVNDRFNGLLYEGVSESPMMLTGGSAAQSSLFPTIDAAFGIEHSDQYFQRIQSYMLRSHREFIRYVKDNIDIKSYVIQSNSVELIQKFDRVVELVTTFRARHRGIVYRYVISNSKDSIDSIRSDQIESNPNVSEADDGVNKGKGTGGTDLKTFLSKSIEETRMARIR